MAVESVQPNTEHPDFDINKKSTTSKQENPNPYGKAWFDDPRNMSKVEKSPARITSIPSPPIGRSTITDDLLLRGSASISCIRKNRIGIGASSSENSVTSVRWDLADKLISAANS